MTDTTGVTSQVDALRVFLVSASYNTAYNLKRSFGKLCSFVNKDYVLVVLRSLIFLLGIVTIVVTEFDFRAVSECQ